MRRKTYTIALIISAVLATLWPTLDIGANSGPTSWEGSAGAEIMTIDQATPIEVISERLTFDFRDLIYDNYTLEGWITASYDMHNTSNEKEDSMMTFPIISYNQIKAEDVAITVDGEAIQYILHPGRISLEDGVDFHNIVDSIQGDYRTDTLLNKNTVGSLISFELRLPSEQYQELSVDVIYDPKTTTIITENFNSGYFEVGHAVLMADLMSEQTASIYYTGERPTVTVGENGLLKSEESMTFMSYYKDRIIPLLNQFLYEDEEVSILDAYDPVSLFNMITGDMQTYFYNQHGIVDIYDLSSLLYGDQLISANYVIDFEPDQTRTVEVRYKVRSSMKNKAYGDTSEAYYTFEYLLNPAKSWKDFGQLTIDVLMDSNQWYIESTNLSLEGNATGYTQVVEGLLDEDITITLHQLVEKDDTLKNGVNNFVNNSLKAAISIILVVMIAVGIFFAFMRKRRL